MKLIPWSGSSLLVPPDWEEASRVLIIPGATVSGYTGWATLSLTPDALVLATPEAVEEIVPLFAIEDVSVIKFEGVLIERQTSVGPLLSPLPYPHGVEVVYSLETRLRLRLRIVTLAGNAAHTWAVDIRRAAQRAQLDGLSGMMPKKRPPEDK
jgi:hypothetical protein